MSGLERMKEWMAKHWRAKSKTDGIVLILTGVLILIVLMPTGESRSRKSGAMTQKDHTTEETDAKERSVQTDTEYEEALEKQLEQLLEHMDGAGEVRVMLTLADDGLTHLDKDTRSQKDEAEATTVIYDTGDEKVPYVILQERPKVEGVVVVAQGGDKPGVVAEITEAIQSLFDLEMHKVKVVKMSVQEE